MLQSSVNSSSIQMSNAADILPAGQSQSSVIGGAAGVAANFTSGAGSSSFDPNRLLTYMDYIMH
jgi:hypothetical protein